MNCVKSAEKESQEETLTAAGNTNSTITQEEQQLLQISIDQTIVRESYDHTPFTEYQIDLQLGGRQWSVSRRYKEFCRLDSQLREKYPGLEFPESSFQIFRSMNKISGVF